MIFKELYSSLKDCENDREMLLNGEVTSSKLNDHLIDLKKSIFYLSHDVFLASKKENIYWSHCCTETYFKNYSKRFKEALINDYSKICNETDFIESEINTLKHLEKTFSDTYYHPELIYPINKKIKLLQNKIETLSSAIKDPLIDYSDSSVAEKIIFLHQVGILDYLKKLSPFNSSTNKLAEYLSAITNEKPTTLQSYLNPINNPTTSQKNNPLNSNSAVKKVSGKLNNIGFFSKNSN